MADINDTLTTLLPKMAGGVLAAAVFSWYDYILFAVMLILSAVIGIYFGCFGSKQATADEYLMGGKNMKVLPIALSLTASHVSGITLLAVPADIYRYGAIYGLVIVSIILFTPIIMYVYLPVFFKLQITSTYEYLERRFDSRSRSFASFLFTLSLFLYLPIVIYVPAMAFAAATGVGVHIVAPAVCAICIFYTTIGGLKAVVWTDALQFTVTLGAVITVFILGVKSAGGFGNILEIARQGERLNIFDFDPNPTKRDSFWTIVFGVMAHWIAIRGIHQSCIQKFLAVPTLREAKLSVVLYSLGLILVNIFSVSTGLIIYSKYGKCDPFTVGAIQRNDQLLPYYVMDVAAHIPGLSGLFIAGIFCAALSTLSSSLNCLAGTFYEDFIAKWISKDVSEQTVNIILRLIVVGLGVVCTGLVFVVQHLGGILPLVLSLTSITSGPLLGMFTLGLLFPRASSKGAYYGGIIGLIAASIVVFTARYYQMIGTFTYEPKPLSVEGCYNNATLVEDLFMSSSFSNQTASSAQLSASETHTSPVFWLFRISFYYYTPLGALATMITSLFITFITKNEDPPVHRDLLSPVIYFLLPEDEAPAKQTHYTSVDQALHLVTTYDK